jgi:hypothetical protein
MVRPEEGAGRRQPRPAVSSCIEPAGESPVRVSAEAPGSRARQRGEICVAERAVKSLRWEGARKRAATSSEACSLVRASAERRTRGPSRSFRGEGNRQRPGIGEAAAGPLRGTERGTFSRFDAEQERPSSAAPRRSEDLAYKATPKWPWSREGVRGARSTCESGENPLEGRSPALVTRAAKVSARAWL